MATPPEPDAHAAYQAYLPEAKALPQERVRRYRLDPELAIINLRTGVKILDLHEAELPVHLPQIDVPSLRALPLLALATKFAATEAEHKAPSEKEIREKLVEAREIRRVLMPVAAGLAATGAIPRHEYEKLVPGRGPWDVASDCVGLASVFRNGGQALAGKHSADPAMIERAAVLGSWLMDHLSKAEAPADKTQTSSAPEVDIRNRLASLLVERHHKLEIIAFYFHGDEYETYVPPLNSRQAPARKATDAEA